ncbi:nucleoside-diphosphate kinase [Cryptosporangium sp. NPDC051539]|uniref:nucleoside-diphosphate kinase n=1 Tax=Cryptosporangium sp. NPDC051539 TaxID=3363962 RepID=UPI0037B8A529
MDARLAHSAVKRQLYSVDTYFRDSWEDLFRIAGNDAFGIADRHAFALLKPDAVVRRKLSAALEWLSVRGWRVVYAQRFRVNRWAVRAFWQYQWNTATRDRREMADLYMSATDSLVLLLRAPDPSRSPAETACSALTRVKGSSDPARCRPGQLRYVLGTLNQQLNLVHSADEPADLVREIGICCTAAERAALYRALHRDDRADDRAAELAVGLESEQERVDLTLAGTVARIRGRLTHPTRLEALLGDALDGRTGNWREIVALADRSGLPLTGWERVVLGTSLLVPTLPHVVPLVPDASVSSATPPRYPGSPPPE